VESELDVRPGAAVVIGPKSAFVTIVATFKKVRLVEEVEAVGLELPASLVGQRDGFAQGQVPQLQARRLHLLARWPCPSRTSGHTRAV
jgi:hypothetical protein